jgi:FtsP/CotA-like multicopper oxidase with cupredoxin domain
VYRSAICLTLAILALPSTASMALGEVAVQVRPPVAAVAPVRCPRSTPGSGVSEPPALYSRRGALNVDLDYVSSRDESGRTLFCFITPDGLESPTLHLHPGDTLNIHLTNRMAPPPGEGAMGMAAETAGRCGAAEMNASSVNIHFHGTATSPTCHADEVINTLVNAGQSFDYHLKIPGTQTPGLYWYHPHVHGQSERAVKGGASGAIVIDGLENVQPAVAGLPERTLIVRDQTVAGDPPPGGAVPTTDVTLNYVPIAYPALVPAVIRLRPLRREFWRVLNASAETVLDLALEYDGVAQPLAVVGLDGVPTGSGGGTSQGKVLAMTHILVPAAGRAEFIVEAPSASVRNARLVTRAVAMGRDGDNEIARTLANLVIETAPLKSPLRIMPGATNPAPARPAGPDSLDRAAITARRKLYFSEALLDPYDPASQPKYFITVDGATPRAFDPADPPAIVTTQGVVEEWTIENRAREMHEFHIHQVHFKLIRRNGEALPPDEQQYLDTTQVPSWSGEGPYPSITVLIDFRAAESGDLLFHCHMLDHEDSGMMAVVRVAPQRPTARATPTEVSRLPATIGERGAKPG